MSRKPPVYKHPHEDILKIKARPAICANDDWSRTFLIRWGATELAVFDRQLPLLWFVKQEESQNKPLS